MSFFEIRADNSDEVLRELGIRALAALEACGQQGVSHAKQTITASGRVDTGAMRNSITHQVDTSENAVYVGTNDEKAIYHEVGTGIYTPGGRQSPWAFQDRKGEWHRTRGIRPIHMIKNSLADHKSEYKGIIEKILRGE